MLTLDEGALELQERLQALGLDPTLDECMLMLTLSREEVVTQ